MKTYKILFLLFLQATAVIGEGECYENKEIKIKLNQMLIMVKNIKIHKPSSCTAGANIYSQYGSILFEA